MFSLKRFKILKTWQKKEGWRALPGPSIQTFLGLSATHFSNLGIVHLQFSYLQSLEIYNLGNLTRVHVSWYKGYLYLPRDSPNLTRAYF